MNNIEESLSKASKAYSDQFLLRAGMNLIPYIGGSLDILLSSKGQNFVSKRIENFISELQNDIATLKEEKVNHNFLNSEEGFDLIVAAFNAAAKTRQLEKLKLYSKVVKSAINTDKNFNENEPEFYLKLIEEISIKEIQAGLLLSDLRAGNIKIPNPEETSKSGLSKSDATILSELFTDFSEDELITYFLRLERSGLIKEVTGNYMGYGGGKYKINETFRKMLLFIEYFKPVSADL